MATVLLTHLKYDIEFLYGQTTVLFLVIVPAFKAFIDSLIDPFIFVLWKAGG